MKNSPAPHKRRGKTFRLREHIEIDGYILLTVLAALLVTAMLRVTWLFTDTALHDSLLMALSVVVLGCLSVTIWRGIAAIRQRTSAYRVSTATAIGSFLCGLFAEILVGNSQINTLLLVAASFISVAAFFLVTALLLGDSEAEERNTSVGHEEPEKPGEKAVALEEMQRTALAENEESNQEPSGRSISPQQYYIPSNAPQPIILPGPHPQFPNLRDPELPGSRQPRQLGSPKSSGSSPPRRGSGQLNIISTASPSVLPPLFEDDPLYEISSPRKARLFMQIKSNDVRVNGEDACAISLDETRFALCDGVSTSNFSRPWATSLAKRWIEQPLAQQEYDAEALDAWLSEPRKRWRCWVYETWLPTINARNHAMGRPEFSKQDTDKLVEQGAASTFLGVLLDPENTTWSAMAIGDTCLFHFSRSESETWRCTRLPFRYSTEFSDTPPSITSNSISSSTLVSYAKYECKPYKPGDMLILATDAMAIWMLKLWEQKNPKILDLLRLDRQEDFVALVDRERATKRMNDDDTTLIVITL